MRFLSRSLHIFSNEEDGLAVRCVASERRSPLFMIKLAVFKKIVNIIMQNVGGTQFCVSLRSGNTVSKHKWGYFTLCKMLQLSGCGCSPRPITSFATYIQHETNCTCQQPRPNFAWILPICNIIFPIIDQCRYCYICMLLILKYSLFLSKTSNKILSKVKRIENGSFVAEMFFLQVDEGFSL